MTLDVKICGLKTVETVEAAIAGGATHCGLIFFEKSPRYVDLLRAVQLSETVRNRARVVAVTVDASDGDLDDIVASVRPDMLQLHGSESIERVTEVKERHSLPVMKALSIREADDLAHINAYSLVADRLLLDAKAPKGSDVPGGHGKVFDWRLLETLDPDIDYMLSGGINAANVADALASTKPTGLDLSSGVERAPGEKDTTLIAAFFEALNQARVAVA